MKQKKIIPNHIRVVLETFLSFKFGVVKSGSSNDKYRIPGLNKLIGKLRATNFYHQYDPVESINSTNLIDKVIEIKRISDPHSHGSVQSLDSLNFISETELKSISKDTLNIISFLDNIHLQKSLIT